MKDQQLKFWCLLSKAFREVVYQIQKNRFNHISNTEKGVENTTHKGVLLTNFEVFRNAVRRSLQCLIYLLNRNEKERVSGEVKSSKSMLIKTGYPNLLYGCYFLCLSSRRKILKLNVLIIYQVKTKENHNREGGLDTRS